MAQQAPLSMGFSGQATGAGCHFLFQASTLEPLWVPGHLWEPEYEPQPQLRVTGHWCEPWPGTLAGRA